MPCISVQVGFFVYDIRDFTNIRKVYFGENRDGFGIDRIVAHPSKKIIYVMNSYDFIFCQDFSFLYDGNFHALSTNYLG